MLNTKKPLEFRKELSFLLVLILLFSLSTPAYATVSSPVITLSDPTTTIGGTVSVNVVISDPSTIDGFQFDVNYDNTKLVYQGATFDSSFNSTTIWDTVEASDNGSVVTVLIFPKYASNWSGIATTAPLTICTLNFNVAANVPTSTALNLSNVTISKFMAQAYPVTTTDTGVITINQDPAVAKAAAIQEFKNVRDNTTTGVTALKAAATTAKANATLVADTDALEVAVTTKIAAVDAANKSDADLTAMADAAIVNTAKAALQTALNELASATTALNTAQAAAVAAEAAKVEAATTKVVELETAAAEDLTIEAKLTAAEAAVTAAKTEVAKLIAGATKTALLGRIATAEATVVAARTAYDAAVAEAAKVAAATAKVLELEAAAAENLTIEAKLTAAEAAVILAKAEVAKVAAGATKTALLGRIATAEATVVAARTAFDAVVAEAAKVAAATAKVVELETAANLNLTVLTNLTAAESAVIAAKTEVARVATGDTKTALEGRITTAETKVTTARTAFDAKTAAIAQFKAVRDNTTTGVTPLKVAAAAAKLNATLVPADPLKNAVDTKVAAVDAANKSDTELAALADAAAIDAAKAALQTALNELASATTALNAAQTAAHEAALSKAEAITLFKAVRDNTTTGVTALKNTAASAKTSATLVPADPLKNAVDTKVAAVDAANMNDAALLALADTATVNSAKAELQTALTELSSAITALNNAQAAEVAKLNAVTSYANSLTATYTIYGDQPFQVTLTPAVPAGITVTGMPTIDSRPAAGAAERTIPVTLTISKDGQQVTKAITIIVKPELNQLQRVVLAALAADTTARGNFADHVLLIITDADTEITPPMIGTTRALGITEDMMTNAEITNALKAYAPYSVVQKAVVRAAIKDGLPAETAVNTANIPNIAGKINGEIAGNPSNNVGIRLFKKMVDTMYDITKAAIAKDMGSNGAQIDFDVTGHETIKATLSDLINSIDSLKIAIAGQAGATNLDKLFNYAEGQVNAASASEIAAFKTFLGSAYVRTYTPPVDPPVNPPVVVPPVVVAPTPDPNVTKGADEVDKAADGTKPINDTTALNNAVNQAAAAVTGTDENKTAANIEVIADQIIAKASDIVTKVTDTAQKEAFIATTSNAISAVINASTAVSTEANAVKLAESFKTIAQEITTLANVTTNTATQQKLVEQQDMLADTMKTVVQNVIENTGTYTATATVQNNSMVVALNQQAVTDLLAKADAVVATANNLTKAVTESGLNVTVEKKIVLDVTTSSTATNLVTELPASVLTQVQAKGIGTVEINTGVAKIAVAPDFITKTATTQAVALEVQKVALTDELRNSMTEQQRTLAQGASAIYDFNAILKDSTNNATTVSNFNSSITISLPYALKAGESKDNITILYLADDGTVKNMAGVYDEATGTVVFSTNHFSKYLIKSNIVKFSDIADRFWAMKEIETMASKGIINGNLAGKYLPNDYVTRAEFAKMISTSLNILDKNATTNLSDVNKSSWYYEHVASAVKAGIIAGKGDGTFGATETITRQDMATMLSRALVNVKGEARVNAPAKYISSFVDKGSIASYAVEGVAASVKHNLMTGKPGNTVDPTGKVTRAEAAVVIYRLFFK